MASDAIYLALIFLTPAIFGVLAGAYMIVRMSARFGPPTSADILGANLFASFGLAALVLLWPVSAIVDITMGQPAHLAWGVLELRPDIASAAVIAVLAQAGFRGKPGLIGPSAALLLNLAMTVPLVVAATHNLKI